MFVVPVAGRSAEDAANGLLRNRLRSVWRASQSIFSYPFESVRVECPIGRHSQWDRSIRPEDACSRALPRLFRKPNERREFVGSFSICAKGVFVMAISYRRLTWGYKIRVFVLTKGMSIIGPRPLPTDFLERYSNRHRMRTAVRPGLECPSLNADGHTRLYQEQFENDICMHEQPGFECLQEYPGNTLAVSESACTLKVRINSVQY